MMRRSLSSFVAILLPIGNPTTVTVGVPWEFDVPCNAANWFTNVPNNNPSADLWAVVLPPAIWSVTGNVGVLPLPGSGQTQTIDETHFVSSAQSVEYWGQFYGTAPTVEGSPAGGSTAATHGSRNPNAAEIDILGRRFFDFRANTAPAAVIVEGIISWTWTGPGTQPSMATCGHVTAVPTTLP